MRGFSRNCLTFGLLAPALGCGKKPVDSPATAGNESKPSPTLSVPNPTNGEPTAPAAPNVNQKFAEAVIEESPSTQMLPPERPRAGVPTGQLRAKVQHLWDTIQFTSAAGKPIVY